MDKILPIISVTVAVFALVIVAMGGSKVEIHELGAITGPDVHSYMNINGELGYQEKTVTIAKTSQYATTTLTYLDSGTTYMLSASGTQMSLPAVQDSLTYKFKVNGALDTANVVIKSSEGDNIEGTLIVAGAVVDCAGEDQINIVIDGENIGDYVELTSDGSQWLIGDSGALTASKMTCTDPS